MTLDELIDVVWFEAYVRYLLAPTLRIGDVVIMDNFPSHMRASVLEMIEAACARLMFLPPYSPDFNPIKMAFAKLEALLRRVTGLCNMIGELFDCFKPQDCENCFAA